MRGRNASVPRASRSAAKRERRDTDSDGEAGDRTVNGDDDDGGDVLIGKGDVS
jgi:hypothetical protein